MKTPPQPKAPRARVMFQRRDNERCFDNAAEASFYEGGQVISPLEVSVLPRSKEAQEGMRDNLHGLIGRVQRGTLSVKSATERFLASANLVEKE